jgi:hypothetical protein
MRDMQEIIAAYAKADSTSRLNYYMEYPSLRSDFLEMERKNGQQATGDRLKSILKKCFCWAAGSTGSKSIRSN